MTQNNKNQAPPGKRAYAVTKRFMLGHYNRVLTPGVDVVEYDPSTGESWVNGVAHSVANVHTAIKSGWLALGSAQDPRIPAQAGAGATQAAGDRDSYQARNMQVTHEDHSEATRIGAGARERMQNEARSKANLRPGTPSATALAAAHPKFEEGKVVRKVVSGDDDSGTVIEGIRMRTPSKVGSMGVNTSSDPFKQVYKDRKAQAQLVQEGISFGTTNISARAADAMYVEDMDSQHDAMWMDGAAVNLPSDKPAPLVEGAPIVSAEQFMDHWIARLMDLALPMTSAELYNLIRIKFNALPEWDFGAHWKTRVKGFRSLPLSARRVIWGLEGQELRNHSANPFEEQAEDLGEEQAEEPVEQGDSSPEPETKPEEPQKDKPPKADSLAKARQAAKEKREAAKAEAAAPPAPPAPKGPPARAKLSSPRKKLVVGAGGSQVEDLPPSEYFEPGGGVDD